MGIRGVPTVLDSRSRQLYRTARRFAKKLQTINKFLRYRIVDSYKLYAMHEHELYAVYEHEHLHRLLHYLKVDCVFDVGANAGQYARMLRKDAHFTGRIISFEPIPCLADEIRRAAAHDDLWTVEEIALASATREGQFNVMAGNQFSSLGTPNHDETKLFVNENVIERRIKVHNETLESAYKRLKHEYEFKRPFLKMDTQGLDVAILKSGEAIAPEFVGLQSELAIKRIYKESVAFRDAISIYNEFGFELSAFVPNNSGHFPYLIETDCIMVRSDLIPHD